MAFQERQLVTVVVDLARFTQAVTGMEATGIAEIVDRFYRETAAVVADHDGRVVKYLGDGCLAVFPPDAAVAAVDAVDVLRVRVAGLASESGLALELGANIHLCTVADGEFGADGRYDVMGLGIVHTFRMGSGPGARISEPVYRKLPSERRTAWTKWQAPATYTQQAS